MEDMTIIEDARSQRNRLIAEGYALWRVPGPEEAEAEGEVLLDLRFPVAKRQAAEEPSAPQLSPVSG